MKSRNNLKRLLPFIYFLFVQAGFAQEFRYIEGNLGEKFPVGKVSDKRLSQLETDLNFAFKLESIPDNQCSAKADFIARYFETLGIPSGKIWAYDMGDYEHQNRTLKPIRVKGKRYRWIYHVATFISGEDGELYVFDPEVFKYKVKISHWVETFIPKRKFKTFGFLEVGSSLEYNFQLRDIDLGVDITSSRIKKLHYGRKPNPTSEFYSNSAEDAFVRYQNACRLLMGKGP